KDLKRERFDRRRRGRFEKEKFRERAKRMYKDAIKRSINEIWTHLERHFVLLDFSRNLKFEENLLLDLKVKFVA
ncbi:11851_t:CDS:2, partial [Rhizophagus irregularis]